MKKLIFGLLVLAALAACGFWLSRRYSDQIAVPKSATNSAARKPGPPSSAVVAIRDTNFPVTAAGEVGSLDAVSVRSEVRWLTSKLTLDIGDKVRKGDILFELEEKDPQTES